MKVFITVDTEAWPRGWERGRGNFDSDVSRDIDGVTRAGPFGIDHQMDVLDEHGLKAVFLVESLFACAVGCAHLSGIVGRISARGHDVQLHVHTEWLKWIAKPVVAPRPGQNIRDYTLDEQTAILRQAKDNLVQAGAANVVAYRAGNYGANHDTLTALARNGMLFDTSYNYPYLQSDCGLGRSQPLLQPALINGVVEFPVSFFRDYPGHYRHAQITACSFAEMRGALRQAWTKGWYSFVVVLHSFELLRGRKQDPPRPRPDYVVIRRFESLCQYLAENRDKYEVSTFCDVVPESLGSQAARAGLRSSLHRTVGRLIEQATRRLR